MTVTKPALNTPTFAKGVRTPFSSQQRKNSEGSGEGAPSAGGAGGQFFGMALNMSWQLALVVLVPVFIGSRLDKHFGHGNTWTFVGLGIAVAGSVLVIWGALQVANKLPVPKLTEAEKRAVKKRYEEEDED